MLDHRCSVLGVCAAVFLVACSAGASPSGLGAPALVPSGGHAAPLAVRYRVLYSFKGGSGDGKEPFAGLVNVNGTLYGTTYEGGASGRIGDGTVFAITRSGTEALLHSFGDELHDGEYPFAGLIDVKNTLYGTTPEGGANGDGTIFSIARSGAETVLYNFKGGSGDGEAPRAGLIDVNGTLYGTTYLGGSCSSTGGCGTIFSITPSGTETVLYSFKGGSSDGQYPFAGLVNVNGTLYGTTLEGGADCSGSGGCGTVFSVTRSGKETVLHSFAGDPDGDNPENGSLIDVKGMLYGTTYGGGTNNRGTVFSITPSGTETVLHSFGGSGDGASPFAGLINVKGTLYSTTNSGGVGDGTIFSITPSGTETVLYSFKGGSGDGENPRAGLVKIGSTLYGTTAGGGTGCSGSYGCGTVFSLSGI